MSELTYDEMAKQVDAVYYRSMKRAPMKGPPVAFVSMEAGQRMKWTCHTESEHPFFAWDRAGTTLVVPTPKVNGRVILMVDSGTGQVVGTGEFKVPEQPED